MHDVIPFKQVICHCQITFFCSKMDRKCNASFCMLFNFSRIWPTPVFFNPVKKEVIYFEYVKGCSHSDTWESKRQICVSSFSPVQHRLSLSSVWFYLCSLLEFITCTKIVFSMKHFVNCSERSVRVRLYSEADIMNKFDYSLWSQ